MKALIFISIILGPAWIGWLVGKASLIKTQGLDQRLVDTNHRDMARWIEREVETGMSTSDQTASAEQLLTTYYGKDNK